MNAILAIKENGMVPKFLQSFNNDSAIDNLSTSILWILKEPHSDLKKQDITDIEKKIFLPTKIYDLNLQIRSCISKKEFKGNSFITFSKYILDFNERIISKNGKNLKLTEKEVALLIFLKKSNKPINIMQLLEKVWNYKNEIESHTVETHVHRLRKKFFEPI